MSPFLITAADVFSLGLFVTVQLPMQHHLQEEDTRLVCVQLIASESGETAA